LLFVAYHLVAPLSSLLQLGWRGNSYDLVQVVESNLAFGDLSYAHFCYGAFLPKETARRRTVRDWLRWLDHRLHAMARALAVDLDRMRRSEGFDRRAVRSSLGLDDADIVFAALGHFGRKGFPCSLRRCASSTTRASSSLSSEGSPTSSRRTGPPRPSWRLPARWPSWVCRTTSGRSSGQATSSRSRRRTKSSRWPPWRRGAAGLPLLATELDGLRDLLADGETGYAGDRIGVSMAAGLRRFGSLPESWRQQMATAARGGGATVRAGRLRRRLGEALRRPRGLRLMA
jgi:hypothetical protein